MNGEWRSHVMQAVERLLFAIGEDVHREGLRDTPKRVAQAFTEWFSGYAADVSQHFRTFEPVAGNSDEMVLVANIPVFSHCEHHLAPFFGVAHIAYVPGDGRVLGLSKFGRVVDAFARRLQVQERLTGQIADCLNDNLDPLGIGVVLECRHLCVESRGISARGVITTTSALRGVLLTKDAARAEFFSLVRSASKAREGI